MHSLDVSVEVAGLGEVCRAVHTLVGFLPCMYPAMLLQVPTDRELLLTLPTWEGNVRMNFLMFPASSLGLEHLATFLTLIHSLYTIGRVTLFNVGILG